VTHVTEHPRDILKAVTPVSDSSASGAGGNGIVPGWYADPYDPRQLRWWDGTQWTEHVSELKAPVVADTTAQSTAATPATSSTAAPLPSRRALRTASAAAVPEQTAPAQTTPAQTAAEQATPKQAIPEQTAAEPTTPEQTAAPSLTPTNPLAIFTPLETAETPRAESVQPLDPMQQMPSAWNEPATIQPRWDTPAASEPVGSAPLWPETVQPETAQPEATTSGTAPAESAQAPGGMDALFAAPNTAAANTAESGAAEPTVSAGTPEQSPAQPWGLTPRSRRSDARPRIERSSTVWVWLVAISPLIAAAAIGTVSAAVGFDLGNWMLPAAIVVPYLLVLLFAVADRSSLVTGGHEHPVSWAWAALTAPIYLLMRSSATRRETERADNVPLLIWVVAVLLAAVGLVGYGYLTGSALIPGLPA
jgi:hypothetical protein